MTIETFTAFVLGGIALLAICMIITLSATAMSYWFSPEERQP